MDSLIENSVGKTAQVHKRREEFAKLVRKLPFTVGDFTFTHVIGQGAFSTVFQATHVGSTLQFAAKCIVAKDQENRKNVVMSEINALKKLYHPNIVKIYDVIEQDNFIYIILEHCGSTTMKDKISKGPICQKNLINYMFQCLKAVACCHAQGVAHRDIKPANLFVQNDSRIILGDFGLSKITTEALESDEFCGSLPFLPPEMIQKKVHDPMKADIWSLGVTFYAMAYGTLPWSLKSSKSLEHLKDCILNCNCPFPLTISSRIVELIRSMMQIQPASRPTAADLLCNPLFASQLTPAQPHSQYFNRSPISKLNQFQMHSHSSLRKRGGHSLSLTFV